MKYLVHLCPPLEFSVRTEALGWYIADDVAEGLSNIHHCTLMASRFPEKSEKELIGRLETLVCTPFDVELDKLDVFREDKNALVVRAVPSGSLTSLHSEALRLLQSFISWDEIRPLEAPWCDDAGRTSVYRLYGSPFYGSFYRPHITLCHLKPEAVSRFIARESPHLTSYCWRADTFYLSKKEQQTWRIIHQFPLI